MALYKLILAYEGTHYNGFQRQAIKTSVQATLEEALRCLGWQGRAIHAAGRTDSGVHALGQVVSFEMEWKHPDWQLRTALNANLPADIAVQQVERVMPGFHPRYDALARNYRYRLYVAPVRNPFIDRFSWRLDQKPDLGLMNQAAESLLGEHDFRAFGKALKEDGTTVRMISQANWVQTGDELWFEIRGNAFLYHMVRRIVWVLVQVGLGKLPLQIVQQGLESGSTGVVALAPARGLTLLQVEYPTGIRVLTEGPEKPRLGEKNGES